MVFERLGVVGQTAGVRFVLDRAVVLAGEQVGDGAPVIPEESICTGRVADDVAGKRGQPGQWVVSAQFAEAVTQRSVKFCGPDSMLSLSSASIGADSKRLRYVVR